MATQPIFSLHRYVVYSQGTYKFVLIAKNYTEAYQEALQSIGTTNEAISVVQIK
jgi:hypothetical protein